MTLPKRIKIFIPVFIKRSIQHVLYTTLSYQCHTAFTYSHEIYCSAVSPVNKTSRQSTVYYSVSQLKAKEDCKCRLDKWQNGEILVRCFRNSYVRQSTSFKRRPVGCGLVMSHILRIPIHLYVGAGSCRFLPAHFQKQRLPEKIE